MSKRSATSLMGTRPRSASHGSMASSRRSRSPASGRATVSVRASPLRAAAVGAAAVGATAVGATAVGAGLAPEPGHHLASQLGGAQDLGVLEEPQNPRAE